MRKSNMILCTRQGVNSTNKRKLVSSNFVFAALPVNREEKTNVVTGKSGNGVRYGIEKCEIQWCSLARQLSRKEYFLILLQHNSKSFIF